LLVIARLLIFAKGKPSAVRKSKNKFAYICLSCAATGLFITLLLQSLARRSHRCSCADW